MAALVLNALLGAGMDFGIDRLIEMFEARFGKWAGTGLLFIVALGAVAVSLHAFFTFLVTPLIAFGASVVDYFRSGHGLLVPAALWKVALSFISGTVASSSAPGGAVSAIHRERDSARAASPADWARSGAPMTTAAKSRREIRMR